mmetsp:Transcript_29682/g.54020  ORF Transcript_29682/g.54020 Transcript_29682/m.54020 type:complete len:891 (-) Transcript_29682:54-2726(-)
MSDIRASAVTEGAKPKASLGKSKSMMVDAKASSNSAKGSADAGPALMHQNTVTKNTDVVVVEEWIYVKWIKGQLDTENACLELPFTITLLVSFSCLALMHLSQQKVFAVERAVELDIIENANFAFAHAFGHKALVDVHSIADFWSWVRLGFIPLTVQPTWGYSEGYDDTAAAGFQAVGATPKAPNSTWQFGAFGGKADTVPVSGDYLHYNRIVGGLRFRQEIGEVGTDLCKFPGTASEDVWKKWYGKPCYPASELSFTPDSTDAESMNDPKRVEYMFTEWDSLERMLAQVVDMEDGCSQMPAKGNRTCFCKWCREQSPPVPWFDERTSRIEISMATYNAEYGLITLTGVNVFLNRGSYMFKRVELMSSWMDLWSTPLEELIPMLVFDAIWIISLLKVVVGELTDIWKIARYRKGRWYVSLYEEYLSPWNVVDWISVFMAAIAVAMYITLQQKSGDMNTTFQKLIEFDKAEGREAYSSLVVLFYEQLENVCLQERQFRLSLCTYPMMVMLRLFKAFSAQPRLAVVTSTISFGYQDLLHFAIVFLSVFSCLCLDAVLLFGQDLEEFSTFWRSLHTCFRLMFGDWDYTALSDISRIYAAVWFWIFMFIIVMIMFNVLLAIIMDAYCSVKKNAVNASTLPQQVSQMRRRRRETKKKERVRLNDVWNALLKEHGGNEEEMMSEENPRKLNAEELCDSVDGMKMKQAIRTLNNALDAHTKETAEPLELEEAHDLLLHFSKKSARVRDSLFETCDMVNFYDTTVEDKNKGGGNPDWAAALAARAAEEPPVTDDVLDTVSTEVGRLSAEVASVLAQTMKHVDRRQNHLEQRQSEMLGSIREMQTSLQMLQSEALQLTTRLQKYDHRRKQEPPKKSAWQRVLGRNSGKSAAAEDEDQGF